MKFASFRSQMILIAAVLPALALAIGQPRQAKAEYLRLVACPSMHPYRPGIALKYGDTEMMARRPGKEFGGSPLRNAPPDRYASNGWIYVLDDNPSIVEYLICVYEDDSEVDYPLPDKAIRGQGRCDFVHKWDGRNFEGEFIRDWPYGLDRKPMAICTFDAYAKRVLPTRKSD